LIDLCVLLCLFTLVSAGVRGQTTASIKLNEETVRAGSTVHLAITLDPAPTYAGRLEVIFRSETGGAAPLGSGFSIASGQTTEDLSFTFPIDVPGGTYKLTNLTFGISQQIDLKFNPVTVKVLPTEGLVHPTAALAALSPTQAQFLQTKSSQLTDLLAKLTTHLSSDSADEPAVRKEVADTLVEARRLLSTTKEQYPTAMGNVNQPTPVFFKDLEVRYSAAIIELRAPQTGKTAYLRSNSLRQDVQFG
jgi:hypothetical protein